MQETIRQRKAHLHKSKENIRTQRAFVGLVDDQSRVACQVRRRKELTQEHTVRHVLQECCPWLRHVFKTDRVTDLLAEWDWSFRSADVI